MPEFLARMEGGIHTGMGTGSPDAARRLAKVHRDHGSTYVEAPVFGLPEATAARQLAIPYAGLQEAKDRVKPLLTAMGGHALFDMGEQAGVPTVIKQLGNFLIISMGRSLGGRACDCGKRRVQSHGSSKHAGRKLVRDFELSQLRHGHCGEETRTRFTDPAKGPRSFQSTCGRLRTAESDTQTLLQLQRTIAP
jgi:hypothetical protein